jgi:hypothetical protein
LDEYHGEVKLRFFVFCEFAGREIFFQRSFTSLGSSWKATLSLGLMPSFFGRGVPEYPATEEAYRAGA